MPLALVNPIDRDVIHHKRGTLLNTIQSIIVGYKARLFSVSNTIKRYNLKQEKAFIFINTPGL